MLYDTDEGLYYMPGNEVHVTGTGYSMVPMDLSYSVPFTKYRISTLYYLFLPVYELHARAEAQQDVWMSQVPCQSARAHGLWYEWFMNIVPGTMVPVPGTRGTWYGTCITWWIQGRLLLKNRLRTVTMMIFVVGDDDCSSSAALLTLLWDVKFCRLHYNNAVLVHYLVMFVHLVNPN